MGTRGMETGEQQDNTKKKKKKMRPKEDDEGTVPGFIGR